MKNLRLLTWLAVFLGTAVAGSITGVGGGQPVELNIQMIPGIWITGATGAVSIRVTTNLDQVDGWALLATVQPANSPYFYVDASATNAPRRFYRVVIESGEPTNQPPVNPDPAHLIWINPGMFTIGSTWTEEGRYSNEGPQTRVTINQGFWMSKYETTQEEYQSVMGSNPSYFKGDARRPVETVSWVDATNYCGKLMVRELAAGRLPSGYRYRLPTEAEWEYACRAGTTTRYNYGDDPDYMQLGNYAWYSSNSDGTTHPVGLKEPNAWGLHDMHGSLWEWCLDWYGTYPGGSVTDPWSPNAGSSRVFRGGGWSGSGRFCRSALRNGNPPATRSYGIGFRPVLAPGQ